MHEDNQIRESIMFTKMKNFFIATATLIGNAITSPFKTIAAIDAEASRLITKSIRMIERRKSFMDIVKAVATRFQGIMICPPVLFALVIYTVLINFATAALLIVPAVALVVAVTLVMDLSTPSTAK